MCSADPSLASMLPDLLEVRRDKKHAKLLQYAQRVWHLDTGSDEERINAALAAAL
jgi:NADP-dependent alcohol dehydrogenase